MGWLGMNGLQAMATQMGLVFFVYGQKEVATTKEEIKNFEKFTFRTSLKGKSSAERKQLIKAYREQIWSSMKAKDDKRYGTLSGEAEAAKAYYARTYIR